MNERAEPSGISLTSADAAIVKAMLARNDRQHDIAAWFGVNGGRIADIKTGKTFPRLNPLPQTICHRPVPTSPARMLTQHSKR
jgi:hypothetical protein